MFPVGKWTVSGRNAKLIQEKELLVGTGPNREHACKVNRKSNSRGSAAVTGPTSDSDDSHLSLEYGKQES